MALGVQARDGDGDQRLTKGRIRPLRRACRLWSPNGSIHPSEASAIVRPARQHRHSAEAPLPVPAESTDPAAVKASLDELTSIFSDIMATVTDVSTRRCPYRDRRDRCTAAFGCRNMRRDPDTAGRVCGGDDKLDFRSAWETG
jgi:hypothetical protein